MRAMNWDDLRYVLAVAREHTLSLAGTRLGVSHTTVGRRVAAIEEALGARLFDRMREAYVPTEAGRDLIAVAERMEVEVLSLSRRVLGKDEKLEGKLRVATMDILFRRYGAAYASFTERHPSIELTVTASEVEVSLLRREADVAVRMTSAPPEHLVGKKIGRVDFAVYGQKGLVERVGADAGYGAFPWLHWDERLQMGWLDGWLEKNAPGARIALRLDMSTLTRHEALAAGIGVHFLACFQGDADPRLMRIGRVATEFSRDVWLLTVPELRHTPRVRAFVDHLDAFTQSDKPASPLERARPLPPLPRTRRKL